MGVGAELDLALVGLDGAADFGVPQIEPHLAAGDGALRLEDEITDRDARSHEGHVRAAHLPAEGLALVRGEDHGSQLAVAGVGGVFKALGQAFPDHVMAGEEGFPIGLVHHGGAAD